MADYFCSNPTDRHTDTQTNSIDYITSSNKVAEVKTVTDERQL